MNYRRGILSLHAREFGKLGILEYTRGGEDLFQHLSVEDGKGGGYIGWKREKACGNGA